MADGIAIYSNSAAIKPMAQSNNSFNRSANSIAFIENLHVSAVRRARLIRAFDIFLLVAVEEI